MNYPSTVPGIIAELHRLAGAMRTYEMARVAAELDRVTNNLDELWADAQGEPFDALTRINIQNIIAQQTQDKLSQQAETKT